MANKSKAKGTAAETRVVKYLANYGIQAERRALSGAEDKGDIKLIDEDIILEVKGGKMTANPSRSQLTEWMGEAAIEGTNSKCYPYLVVARHGKNPKDYDVWTTDSSNGSTWYHWYLNDWCAAYPYV